MSQSTWYKLILVLAVVAVAVYIILPSSPGLFSLKFDTRLGLDLVGGVQALLEADLPAEATVTSDQMKAAVAVVENRVNGLGLTEAVVQQAGERRIVVELPGETDPETALATIRQTGLLEFVDMSKLSQAEAEQYLYQKIKTDFGQANTGAQSTAVPTEVPPTEVAPTEVSPTETVTTTTPVSPTFQTVMTGADLNTVTVERNPQNAQYMIGFTLSNQGSRTFAEYTTAHVGTILAIVVDKTVISIPGINEPITSGQGSITGNFDYESANALAVQLRYGSLPFPLKIVESRTVGPTLGQDSLRRSLMAGIIGFTIVILFMSLYYRLPGLAASLAIIIYALVLYAIFRFGVTLTLPGIAGLMLSTGSALDANILIFERLKEELRSGKTLRQAVDLGWRRAWPSIRDSNVATILTSLILFWFGNTYGATIVKGFSITLFLGVLVSLFTALLVTRVFVEIIVNNLKSRDYTRWFGI